MNGKPNENELSDILDLFEKTFGWRATSPAEIPIGVCWEDAQGNLRQWNGSAFVLLAGKKQPRTPEEIRKAQLDLTGPPIPQVPEPASELFVGPPAPELTLTERLKAISRKLSGAVSLDEDTEGNLCDIVDQTEFYTALAALDEIAGEVGELENHQ